MISCGTRTEWMTVFDVEPALDMTPSFNFHIVIQDNPVTHQPLLEQGLHDLAHLDLDDLWPDLKAQQIIDAAATLTPTTEAYYLRAALLTLTIKGIELQEEIEKLREELATC